MSSQSDCWKNCNKKVYQIIDRSSGRKKKKSQKSSEAIRETPFFFFITRQTEEPSFVRLVENLKQKYRNIVNDSSEEDSKP